MRRIAARSIAVIALVLAFASPIIAQVQPIDREKPVLPHPVLPSPTSPANTPLPMPTLAPLPIPTLIPAPGMRTFRRATLGVPQPLSKFPRLPSKPPIGLGGLRHVMAGTGASMNVSVDPLFNGSCSTTVGGIYNTGCDVGIFASDLPTGNNHQDYYIDATASTATSVGSGYAGGNNDPGVAITLSHSGTYVLASYDTVLGQWDAVSYIDVTGASVFNTYADASHNIPSTQFVAKSSVTVYIDAQGLTPTDLYEVYVEFTSYKVTCVFESPPESPVPGANTLCNPANSAGQNAPGGDLAVSWPLSTSFAPGTYSIVIYDKTVGKRIGERQVVLTKNGGGVATSTITPNGGNASPAPAPAGTPSSTIAFDSTSDQSDSGFTFAISGLTASRNYRIVNTDPEGAVTTWGTFAANASGNLSVTYSMSTAREPSHYIANTYSFGAYDTVTNTMAATQAYKIVGYNVLTQFTSPLGTSLVLPSAGSTTSGLQFTNNSDTKFGGSNGDPISKIEWDTYTSASGANGISISLLSGSACGANVCQTVTDTNGQNWTATQVCGGGGANKYCSLTLVPVTAGYALPVGQSVSVTNISFINSVGSHCSTNCAASTYELPQDGLTWSVDGVSESSNPVYFTNGFGTTYSATGHIYLYGERVGNSGLLTVGKDAHGYTPRFNQAFYANSQPINAPSGQNDVFLLKFNNTSSGGNVTQLMVTLGTAFSPGNQSTFVGVDPASPTAWTIVACPSGSPGSAFCLQNGSGNSGIAAGTSQTIYFDTNPPPANAFSYSDMSVQAIAPQSFTAAADGTVFPFVPSSSSIDTFAVGSFSLDSTLIQPLFAPTSEGTSTNNQVTISVQNASTGASPYPDYLDLFAIDVPTANPLTSIGNVTANFSYLGSTVAGSNTRYWFGLCTNQFTTLVNPPNDGVVSCGSATEQNSIAPGNTFSFTANIQTGASAGSITATEYAHGANGGGWSAGRTFNLTVSAVSAVAGFTYAGAYSATPVANLTSPTQPTVGADSDPTYGSSFIYEIKSNGTNPITSATITIPGTNVGGGNGADNGTPNTNWTITAAPTLSGNGSSGCTVSSYTSTTTGGANGSIVITGCNIASGQVLDVTFPMKTPYDVNSTFKFSTVVNGAINASEAWFSDTQIKVVLSGQIVVTVDPANPGPGGSTPSIVCPSCVFDTTLNQIQFRNIPNSTTDNYTDPMRVSVYTNAGTSNTWSLTVQASNNPAHTGSAPTNELEMGVDTTNSHLPAGIVVDQGTVAVVPTSGNLLLVNAPTGINPQRAPFDILDNFSIAIGTEAIVPQTSVLTYTYIAN